MILYLQRVTKELSPKTIKLSSVISSRIEVEPRFGTKYDDYEEYVKNNIIGGEDVDIVIVQSMLLTGL